MNINNENPKDRSFWEHLAQISLNPYFTNADVDSLLDRIKEKLEIKDDDWYFEKDNGYYLYFKARKIALVGKRCYGYNIFWIAE